MQVYECELGLFNTSSIETINKLIRLYADRVETH